MTGVTVKGELDITCNNESVRIGAELRIISVHRFMLCGCFLKSLRTRRDFEARSSVQFVVGEEFSVEPWPLNLYQHTIHGNLHVKIAGGARRIRGGGGCSC